MKACPRASPRIINVAYVSGYRSMPHARVKRWLFVVLVLVLVLVRRFFLLPRAIEDEDEDEDEKTGAPSFRR